MVQVESLQYFCKLKNLSVGNMHQSPNYYRFDNSSQEAPANIVSATFNIQTNASVNVQLFSTTMDLSQAPPELIWTILDSVTDLQTRKNLSLVSSQFNRMVFGSTKAQEKVNLRIVGGNRTLKQTEKMFNEFYTIMKASERNYVNVAFLYVCFLHPAVVNFPRFLVTACETSIKCLKFIKCLGPRRSVLLEVLGITKHLSELYVHSHVMNDITDIDVPQLNSLRKISLKMMDTNVFFQDICKLAPNLEDLQIETRGELSATNCLATAAVEYFSGQLKRLSFKSDQALSNDNFMRLRCQKLVELNLNVVGSINTTVFRSNNQLRSLNLEGDITDEVLYAVSQMPTIENLSLGCRDFHGSTQFAQLNHLRRLKSLKLRGIFNYSWDGIALPELRKLHVQSVGEKWSEFIEKTQLQSLEIHDRMLNDDSLQAVCRSLPKLKRLELNGCGQITDEGLQHIEHLGQLEELRLWEVKITNDVFRLWHRLPSVKKLLIFASITMDDDALPVIESKLPNLKQLVLYDCYRIASETVEMLQDRLPECEILQIFHGDPVPPSLKQETQAYQRTGKFPDGVFNLALPYVWD